MKLLTVITASFITVISITPIANAGVGRAQKATSVDTINSIDSAVNSAIKRNSKANCEAVYSLSLIHI